MENKGILGALHPSAQLVLLVALALAGLAMATTLGFMAWAVIFGVNSLELLAQGGNVAEMGNLNFIRYSQVISHLGLFIIPSVVFAILVGRQPLQYLNGNQKPLLTSVLLAILAIVAALPLVNYLMAFNAGLQLPEALAGIEAWMKTAEERAKMITHAFLEVDTWQGLAFNIFMIAVIPSIGEEFVFRGILQKIFRQWTGNAHLAVWISAFLFSAMHMQFYGFLPRLFLGAVLGYMLVSTGNIWVPVLAHFFNNTAAVTVFYLKHNNYITVDIEQIGLGSGAFLYAIFSLIATVMLLLVLRRIHLRQNLFRAPSD